MQMPKNKKLALNSRKQTYQILTNNDRCMNKAEVKTLEIGFMKASKEHDVRKCHLVQSTVPIETAYAMRNKV